MIQDSMEDLLKMMKILQKLKKENLQYVKKEMAVPLGKYQLKKFFTINKKKLYIMMMRF